MTTATDQTQPRIYVACLAAYNNGILHGAWLDADEDPDAIRDGIRAMLRASPMPGAEEWTIHDHDEFEGVSVAEYASIEHVAALARFIVEHGRLGAELIDHFGDINEARAALADRYLGVFDSLAAYMQELTEDAGEIPEHLRYYIDWDSMARDAELSGDLLAITIGDGRVYVFAGR